MNYSHHAIKLIKCDGGATAVQYGLFAALIGSSLIGVLGTTGTETGNTLTRAAIVLETGGDLNPLSQETGNGGLEAERPTNSSGQSSWSAGVDMEGWTSSNGMEVWGTGFLGLTAVDGDTFVELDGGNGSTMDQYSKEIPTLAGQEYVWSFSAAQRGSLTESMVLKINGEIVETYQPVGNNWAPHDVRFTATGNATTITFEELSAENNSRGILIDGVTVSEG